MNPFSSQFVNPQNAQFQTPCAIRDKYQSDGHAIEHLCNRITNAKVLQIVGPHGCGKSTLACSLASHLIEKFSSLHSVILRRTSGFWQKPELQWNLNKPFEPLGLGSENYERLIVIDGIEAIGPVSRRVFVRQLVNQNCRLLLTTHRRMWGINTLIKLTPTLEHFRQIVNVLQRPSDVHLSSQVIDKAFFDYDGNYRDAMWALYDQWEQAVAAQQKTTLPT